MHRMRRLLPIRQPSAPLESHAILLEGPGDLVHMGGGHGQEVVGRQEIAAAMDNLHDRYGGVRAPPPVIEEVGPGSDNDSISDGAEVDRQMEEAEVVEPAIGQERAELADLVFTVLNDNPALIEHAQDQLLDNPQFYAYVARYRPGLILGPAPDPQEAHRRRSLLEGVVSAILHAVHGTAGRLGDAMRALRGVFSRGGHGLEGPGLGAVHLQTVESYACDLAVVVLAVTVMVCIRRILRA